MCGMIRGPRRCGIMRNMTDMVSHWPANASKSERVHSVRVLIKGEIQQPNMIAVG